MKILIAEDDPISRRVLEATLVKWGHEVIVAHDGDQALAVLQKTGAPSLAILDWMMPGKDGIEVCHEVRHSVTATPPYIILLTARTDKKDVVAGLEAGADDYLTKPFARGELRARIDVGTRVVTLQKKLADRVVELDHALAEQERADKSLRLSERRYRHLVEQSQGFICTHDYSGKLLSVNPAAAKQLEYQPDEMIGRNLREFIAPSHSDFFDFYLERIAEDHTYGGLLNVITKSGAERVWQYHNARYQEPGNQAYVLGHAQDVTELKLAEDRLRNLSVTDEMTGLHNQRGFFTLATQYMKTARREGQSFALIYADMDGLKRINDTHGHLAGSEAIKTIADILRNSFRASDVVARLGGDEFGILVAHITAGNIRVPLDHLQNHLNRYNAQALHTYELSLSVGAICVGSETEASMEQLLSQADRLMYEEKRRKQQTAPAVREQGILVAPRQPPQLRY